MSDPERFRRLRPDEAEQVARRGAVSFGAFDERDDAAARVRPRLEAGEYWGLDVDGTVRAQCRLTTVEHWFGGSRVPCQHVASVAVAPEDRGQGAARRLMAAAVRHGAAEGSGLSLLFPATDRPYRSAGYEHAGTFTRYRLDASRVPALGPRLRPATEEDWPAIQACAEQATSRLNGPAVRPAERWEELRHSRFHYVLDAPEPGGVQAYALFNHRRTGDWQYTLAIADWAALTTVGLEALVGLVGSHGSLGKDATLRGPVPELWSLLLSEQDLKVDGGMRWMARGLDLETAVAARGFGSSIAARVNLAVDDPLLPAVRGPWTLDVAGGHGRLVPAREADVRLHPRAVGPLFTGMYPPGQLALAGLVRGPAAALQALTDAFAGPLPHLLDFF